ncbi:hypothetical protein HDU87_000143 [Geranomyces variabilis]|uniref:Uncharacterized protein n=1 Tax=Geranomyces variabilis TaxID=109894 RepID=A0AAD5TRS5_9FUNG|nr:hypothetical protein HDU87_000143 [Geranomyces variabilis]
MPETTRYVLRSSSSLELPNSKAALMPDVSNIFTADELSGSTLHRDSKGSNASVSRMFADEELYQYPPAMKDSTLSRKPQSPLSEPPLPKLSVGLPRLTANISSSDALPVEPKGLLPSGLRHFAAAVKCGHFLRPESEEPVDLEGPIFERWETTPKMPFLRRGSSAATK